MATSLGILTSALRSTTGGVHDRLVEHDRDGSARYAFVLFDVSGREPTALLKQREPAAVGRQVGARGGWGPSGHDSRGEQYKLPIDAIFPEWSP